MAAIIRHGKTPKWGIGAHSIQGVIIDSYNESFEIKDYEQTDSNGTVCGYLIYDQTKNFDISGTVLACETSFSQNFKIGHEVTDFIYQGLSPETLGMNCQINTPNTAILKSLTFSQTAGGAQTFSASGTIYAFCS